MEFPFKTSRGEGRAVKERETAKGGEKRERRGQLRRKKKKKVLLPKGESKFGRREQ